MPAIKEMMIAHLERYKSLRKCSGFTAIRANKLRAVDKAINALKSIDDFNIADITMELNTLGQANAAAKGSSQFCKSGYGLLDEIIDHFKVHIDMFNSYSNKNKILPHGNLIKACSRAH